MKELYSVQALATKLKISVTRVCHYINNKKVMPDFMYLYKGGKTIFLFYKRTIDKIASNYEKYLYSRCKVNKKMPKL